jgi:antitoxin component of RelBE/YafQ-DinJ toxin-antitoxin module
MWSTPPRPLPFKCDQSRRQAASGGCVCQTGLTFTDAVNIFIQQSLNEDGLPFLASPENAEFMKAKAMRRLMDEVQKGWDSRRA